MPRPIDAYAAIDMIDEWLDSVGTVMVGKGLSSYGELIGCIEDTSTLTPPNEWVSVDNKLPKNGVPVLIGNPHWDYPVVASYDGSGVWMDSWHQKMTFTPTCWMLLPAPPAKEDRK